MLIDVPRDRSGAFEPHIIPKHQRRLLLFDDKIFSLYVKGMSTRDIAITLLERYGIEVSPTLISQVTEQVMEAIRKWQARPLDEV